MRLRIGARERVRHGGHLRGRDINYVTSNRENFGMRVVDCGSASPSLLDFDDAETEILIFWEAVNSRNSQRATLKFRPSQPHCRALSTTA